MLVRGGIDPSAGTLHCDQDLIFATEIGKLLDASNQTNGTPRRNCFMLGCAPSASMPSATLLLTRGDHPRSSKELLGNCTTSSSRTTSPEPSKTTSKLSSCSTAAVKGTGIRSPALSSAAFYLRSVAFSKWAMLGSNQRPPPCKRDEKDCEALQWLAESAYLSRIPFTSLHTIAEHCAPGDVRGPRVRYSV
jgi:hypothetical protein